MGQQVWQEHHTRQSSQKHGIKMYASPELQTPHLHVGRKQRHMKGQSNVDQTTKLNFSMRYLVWADRFCCAFKQYFRNELNNRNNTPPKVWMSWSIAHRTCKNRGQQNSGHTISCNHEKYHICNDATWFEVVPSIDYLLMETPPGMPTSGAFTFWSGVEKRNFDGQIELTPKQRSHLRIHVDTHVNRILACTSTQQIFNDTACNGARGSPESRHKALRI